jgi:flagellar biosynthesis protein FlhG
MYNETEARELARKHGMAFIDIDKETPDHKCIELLKEGIARQYNAVPVRFLNNGVLVAISDPNQKYLIDLLSTQMGKKVYPALADREAIQRAIESGYPEKIETGEAPVVPIEIPKEEQGEPVIELPIELPKEAPKEVSKEAPKGVSKGVSKEVPEEAQRSSRIISILSNKGGVGKTHISTNLAKVIGESGKKALLIDADLGNADISNKLAMFPEYTLYDFLLGDVALENMVEKTNYGFDLIGGSSGEFKLANINYIQRTKFIRGFRKLSANYDFTIFDLSAGISNTVVDFALASDETIIVTTPQDIIAGYACIKASFQRFKAIEESLLEKVEDYKPKKLYKPWVIMNQVTNLRQGLFLFNRICQTTDERINNMEPMFAVKPEYLGGILYDRETFKKAEMDRKPLSTVFPRSNPAQCMTYLGKNLLEAPDLRTYKQQLKTGLNRFALIFGLE